MATVKTYYEKPRIKFTNFFNQGKILLEFIIKIEKFYTLFKNGLNVLKILLYQYKDKTNI